MPPIPNIEMVITLDPSGLLVGVRQTNAAMGTVKKTIGDVGKQAENSFSGMAVGMAKGILIAHAVRATLQTVVEGIKQVTAESALYAARAETMAVVIDSLARVNSLNVAQTRAAVEAVRSQGIALNEARESVARLIGAQIDLSKASQLARVAQDAAVIAGVNSSEAFEGIVNGIVTQQVRVLRTYGIMVDFQGAFIQKQRELGRELTEVEKKNVALNLVLGFGRGLFGTYEAAMETAGKQMTSLKRHFDEAKNAIGQGFMPVFRAVIKATGDLAIWAKENGSVISATILNIGTALYFVAGAWAAAKIVSWAPAMLATIGAAKSLATAIAGIGAAINLSSGWLFLGGLSRMQAMKVAVLEYAKWSVIAAGGWKALAVAGLAAVGPVGWIALVAGGIAAIVLRLRNARTEADALNKALGDVADDLLQELKKAKPDIAFPEMVDALVEAGIPGPERLKAFDKFWKGEEQARRAATARRLLDKEAEAIRIQEIEQEQVEKSADLLRKAIESHMDERDKLFAKAHEQMRELTKEGHLSAQARLTIERALQTELIAVDKSALEKRLEDAKKFQAELLQAQGDAADRALDQMSRRLELENELAERILEMQRDRIAFQETVAGMERDAQLRQLEYAAQNAQTIEQKIALEAKRAEIEIAHEQRVHDIRMRLFQMETDMEAGLWALRLKREGATDEAIARQVQEFLNLREQLESQLGAETQGAIQAAQENAAVRQAQIINDEQRRIFDSLKRQAEGVFDALLAKSQSVWSAIGNAFKTAMLTAIKEVVTSNVARILMQMFGGMRIGVGGVPGGGAGAPAPTRAAGFAGALAGIFGGGVPIFGPGSISGGFGGTAQTVPAGGGGASGAGGLAGLAGILPGLKSLLGIGGSIQTGAGTATTWAAASMGQRLQAIAGSPAAMLAGGLLALSGIQRGGKAGFGMSVGGGALLGFGIGNMITPGIGGAIGAGIGAAAGAIGGLFGLFRKSPEERAKEKIRAAYGVTIHEKSVLRQIVEIARQNFGSNLDMAIRSQQVVELIELYAMTTDQRGNFPRRMQALSLAQSSGGIFQLPSFYNGVPSSSGGSVLNRVGAGMAASAAAAPIETTVRIEVPVGIDGQVIETRVVQVMLKNGRAVAAGLLGSFKSNAGRKELWAAQQQPGLVVS